MERLFSEIYNRYFGIVARLLAPKGVISQKTMKDTVQKYGFGESLLFLVPHLTGNTWELFEETGAGYRSKLRGGVKLPLSRLQMRWIRAVLSDPRAGLFLEDSGREALQTYLSDAEPLFRYEDFHYFDRFSDADDYMQDAYREHFRLILQAIRGDAWIFVRYEARPDKISNLTVKPLCMEYSVKNDCFRLRCIVKNKARLHKHILRISRMKKVKFADAAPDRETEPLKEMASEKVTIRIRDVRNAMERAMLQFADYRKNTQRLEDNSYRCEIFYDKEDETELLIEILSFGPMIEVEDTSENGHFLGLIRERLQKQIAAGGW